jgi:hypothetical protein
VSFGAVSDALHERVRRFADGSESSSFEELALAIARFQAEASPGFARLVETRGSELDSVASIPGVPAAAFRFARVSAHPPSDDVARFSTSGTTGVAAGVHAFRTTETYASLALRSGARALRGTKGSAVVVSLAPAPVATPDGNASSLAFMMRLFAREWDGRPLEGTSFDELEAARWLVADGRVNVRGLERALRTAFSRGEPLVVLATAFALVGLLEALAGRTLETPADSVVMVTGGYKGRSRAVEKGELRRGVARAFGLPESNVVGEYGMTELTSQLYEGTLPGAELRGPPDVFLPPPWLRVEPVEPATLEPVARGETGIARFVDLGNIDSAVAVQTDDLVRAVGDGIELLGRREGAEPRGCSLALEALLA